MQIENQGRSLHCTPSCAGRCLAHGKQIPVRSDRPLTDPKRQWCAGPSTRNTNSCLLICASLNQACKRFISLAWPQSCKDSALHFSRIYHFSWHSPEPEAGGTQNTRQLCASLSPAQPKPTALNASHPFGGKTKRAGCCESALSCFVFE